MRLFHHLSSKIWAGNAYPCDLNDLRSYRWKSEKQDPSMNRDTGITWDPRWRFIQVKPLISVARTVKCFSREDSAVRTNTRWMKKVQEFHGIETLPLLWGGLILFFWLSLPLASSRWLLIGSWDITTGSNPSVLLEFDFLTNEFLSWSFSTWHHSRTNMWPWFH